MSTEAYLLFLRAYVEPDYDKTIELFEQALAADAEFAAPRAALAFLWASELINTNFSAAVASEAAPSARQGTRLRRARSGARPDIPFARSALTLTDMLNWRWTEAYERLVVARDRTPNDVTQYDIFLLSYLGRYEEALDIVQRGSQLYPNEPDNVRWTGWAHGFAGRYDEAAAALHRRRGKTQR